MKKLAIILFSILSITGFSQDPQFTQFFYNPLYLAPSFAGAIEASRLTSMYRTQWSGIGNPFVTYSFSYDHYFDQFNSGFGLLFLSDAAGSGRLGMTSIGFMYSYDFQIFNTWHVRPGLHFNYLQTGIDYNKLFFSSQISDGVIYYNGLSPQAPANDKIGDIDVSTSVLIYTKKLWFGGTVDHLLSPEVSLYLTGGKVPIKYTAFGGIELVRKGKLLKPLDETLVFATLYRQQYIFRQLDFGLYWYKMPIVAGIWVRGLPKMYDIESSEKTLIRVGDAIAFLVGYKVSTFSIGYSYDFTVSKLITSTNGSHEVSLVYNFRHERRKKITSIPCPSF